MRDAIDQVESRLQFDPATARPAAAMALELLGLAADVAQRYEQRKRELGVLDFDDLLIRARQLLVGPEQAGLRQRLAAHIRLLLVDEFQDTDARQVEMLKAICDNEYLRGKLFCVGDYKQSIYRFRGAEPDVFRQLRGEVPAAGRMSLTENFRSQPAVLDFVNWLFCEELGEDYEPLQPHRPQSAPGRRWNSSGRATIALCGHRPKVGRERARVRAGANFRNQMPSPWPSPKGRGDERKPSPKGRGDLRATTWDSRAASPARGRLDRPPHPRHARREQKRQGGR